jgi:hypothetical protein
MKLCKSCKHRKKIKEDHGAFHCALTARLCGSQPDNASCVNYERSIVKVALSLILLVLGLLFVNGRYHA